MNKKEIKTIQIIITLTAITIALMHIICPKISIDGIILTLVIIAIIPRLAPLFKSLEFPGVLKIQFQNLKKVEDKQ